MIKRKILNSVNYLLKPFGISIYKYGIDMDSAVRRIKDHKIHINTVIDIGGSTGRWSVSAMPVFPEAQFLVVEPLHERLNVLKKNSSKHINFDFEQCVAGETDNEKVILNIADDLDGSTVNGSNGAQREVLTRTIDSLVKERKLKGPFLIKFDTHGFEIPIIKGALRTLKETNIIVMEVYNFKLTQNTLVFYDMCKLLEEYGFRSYDLVDPMLRPHDNSFWQMDLFFAKKDMKMFDYNSYK